jgi:hypothetical protein
MDLLPRQQCACLIQEVGHVLNVYPFQRKKKYDADGHRGRSGVSKNISKVLL